MSVAEPTPTFHGLRVDGFPQPLDGLLYIYIGTLGALGALGPRLLGLAVDHLVVD